MILKTLMKEQYEVYTSTEDSRISEVASLMQEKRVGAIVVVDKLRLVTGIVTDRDIAMGLALGVSTADSFVSQVMTHDVETISHAMTLFGVARVFRETDVKRLPVVDDENRLVGIVSSDDVIALLAREMFDTCNSFEPKLGHVI